VGLFYEEKARKVFCKVGSFSRNEEEEDFLMYISGLSTRLLWR
jgi:hypothetical protein